MEARIIAVSTFRPHKDSEEYRQNQIRAMVSWFPIFNGIILMGKLEPELANSKTSFTFHEGRPHVRDMVGLLATQTEMGVWINADIVLDSAFVTLERVMRNAGCVAATSFRLTFDPVCFPVPHQMTPPPAYREKNDWGLDVFVATPEVWQDMYKHMDPRWVKCGQVYDSWMVGFLNKRHKCGDFTDRKWVFHPRHGGRVTEGMNSPQWAVGEFSEWAGPPRYWLTDGGLIPKKWGSRVPS